VHSMTDRGPYGKDEIQIELTWKSLRSVDESLFDSADLRSDFSQESPAILSLFNR
jgi:hypothetical protein